LRLKAWRELADTNMQVCLFSILYALMGEERLNESIDWGLLTLIASLAAYLCYGVLVNDICDMEVDAAAGKKRSVREVPKMILTFLTGFLFLTGLLLAPLHAWDLLLFSVMGSALLLCTFYSAPPLRFKERGVLGVVVDMMVEKTLPVLAVFTFFRKFSLDALLGILVFSAMQLKIILDHQIFDYQADVASGVETLVVRLGPRRSQALVDGVVRPLYAVAYLLFCFALYLRVPPSLLILLPLLAGFPTLKVMLKKEVIIRVNIRGDIGGWVERIPLYDGYITASLGPLILFLAAYAALASPTYLFLLPLALASQLYIVKGHYLRLLTSLRTLMLGGAQTGDHYP